jgi:hypothetical protein
MKTVTFLWTDPKTVRGPLTFARLRKLWNDRTITAESKLFVTERDEETNKVRCQNLKAEDIRHELETGAEIDLDRLFAE